MSILTNKERVGAFTSSEIYKLLGTPKPRATYIEEKKIERRLGRSLNVEAYSRPMAWGHFMELVVFNKFLGMEYEHLAQETKAHDSIKFWAGSTDYLVEGEKISDLKSYQPKKFCQYTDVILSEDIQALKNNFKAEYWQLVSNAIINNVSRAEAISFMPYESEIEELRKLAVDYDPEDGSDVWKYRFIAEAPLIELPYLPDGGYYKNFNRFEFEVPQEDKEILINAVLIANKEAG